VAEAIRGFELDPNDLPAAVAAPSALAYLEFHIEQGPVLESQGAALGVVEAIAGQTRMEFIFTGQANHAGTTPMGALRRDALAATAQWIVEVERYAGACPGLVATVAKVESTSTAANVIAGRCTASLDIRHADDRQRQAAVQHLIEFAYTAAAARGVSVSHSTSNDQPAVPMAGNISELLASAVLRATGADAPRIISGAGHDAMIVARRIPAAMLFLRSPGGLSHHPNEAVLPEDVAAAYATGLEFLRGLRDDRAMLERIAATSPELRRETHA
jgi:allantoate deiminase